MQTINITSHYAWDQSDKNVILYVPIPKANEINNESYTLEVQSRSIQLGITDHHGVNYNFKLSNLCGDLIPAEFEIKFKPTKVVLHLQKKETGKHWNDIKVKKISDVYSQVQRQIDASQAGKIEPVTKAMEENIINDYGASSIQGDMAGTNLTAENQQKGQRNPQSTLNPFDISDTVSPP